MSKVYLALYKGRGGSLYDRFTDGLIRHITKGQYSHCEIAIEQTAFLSGDYYPYITYDCYSSSPRDGGVRKKEMTLKTEKWDLIPLDNLTEEQVKAYFKRTKGANYDWQGVFGLVLGFREKKSKFFCSEWCFNAIFRSEKGWRFNPNQLAQIVAEILTGQ
ncbi:enoyl-CoA hydratase [Histophilus somni]|uniref:enoyl-CoA hydratase n=1 Tax=Histophilus somni TaxID=731 RepID=UPI0018EE3DBD|nr:enoyl-CoA hydratase [Histophilus somni]QQF80329.1 enoyl-CoA hydratase [Histophilus somni]